MIAGFVDISQAGSTHTWVCKPDMSVRFALGCRSVRDHRAGELFNVACGVTAV